MTTFARVQGLCWWGLGMLACGGAYTREPAGTAGSPGSAGATSSSMEGTTVGGFGSTTTAGGFGGSGGKDSAGVGGGPVVNPEGCYCTRRPGPGQSFRCPTGVDDAAALTVEPTGGRLVLEGQQGGQSGVPFSLEVPPNVLTGTTIMVTETSLSPPADFTDYSPVYEIQPQDLLSKVPLRIVIPWGNRDGAVPQALAIYRAHDPSGPYARLADSYVNAGFMQGSVSELGYFFAGAPKTSDQLACP